MGDKKEAVKAILEGIQKRKEGRKRRAEREATSFQIDQASKCSRNRVGQH